MDFDFAQIAVPFRMQPGLRRVERNDCILTPLDAASRLYAEKHALHARGGATLCAAGFDPAAALRVIEAHTPGGHLQALVSRPLELRFEEDFAVLDARGGTVPWLSVWIPTHWAPEDKLGLSLAAIHGPVADGTMLRAASQQLTRLVTGGEYWERYVWTLSPSPRYDQHPRRQMRAPWPQTDDPAEFAAGCWLRVERQTFLPVLEPGGKASGQAVFAIRVLLEPLAEAVDTSDEASRLRDSLLSMTPAVLDYKGLSAAREPVARWLGTLTG